MYYNTVNIVNSIIWENLDETQTDQCGIEPYIIQSLNIYHSDIEGGWEGDGNINTDPLFFQPNMGNFMLQDSSLCIDAGTSSIEIEGEPILDYGEDGLPVVSSHDTDGEQQYADNFQHKKPRVKANSDGAFIIWNDFFRPDASGNIYIQKITHENNGLLNYLVLK